MVIPFPETHVLDASVIIIIILNSNIFVCIDERSTCKWPMVLRRQ